MNDEEFFKYLSDVLDSKNNARPGHRLTSTTTVSIVDEWGKTIASKKRVYFKSRTISDKDFEKFTKKLFRLKTSKQTFT